MPGSLRGGSSGGGGPTAISDDITPTSGTPATFGDGQFITDCMFAGWEVSDSGPTLQSMADDGVECSFNIDNTVQLNHLQVNNILTNLWVMHPTTFVGDFHLQAYVANSGTGHSTNEIMFTAGGGDTVGECHTIQFALNLNTGTTWQRYGILNASSSHYAFTELTTLTAATHRWIAIERVGDLITFRDGGTAAIPSWTDLDSERQDLAGGACRIGFQMITGLAGGTDYSFKRLLLDGFTYSPGLDT